jgi:uncharacterized damage-inducible protein DinB
MNPETLSNLIGYNKWANQHLLTGAHRVAPEELQLESPFFDHQTAWKTLLHLFDVEWSWLKAARGESMQAYLWDVTPLPDLAALSTFARLFGAELEAYVADLGDEHLMQQVDIGTAQGRSPEWVTRADILVHLVNHGTAHRSELAHWLTGLGHSPGEVDYMDHAVAQTRQEPRFAHPAH